MSPEGNIWNSERGRREEVERGERKKYKMERAGGGNQD
jgi:hypothetical protein